MPLVLSEVGGAFWLKVTAVSRLSSLYQLNRGPLEKIRGISAVSNSDLSIAERQKIEALKRLNVSRPIEIYFSAYLNLERVVSCSSRNLRTPNAV